MRTQRFLGRALKGLVLDLDKLKINGFIHNKDYGEFDIAVLSIVNTIHIIHLVGENGELVGIPIICMRERSASFEHPFFPAPKAASTLEERRFTPP